ncbi:MAG: hypothetical protein NC924_08615 [Candidatus Omnitrophica bacterium]|nr:hypothetical protein [Candidatus Omnitrophota bacterium]
MRSGIIEEQVFARQREIVERVRHLIGVLTVNPPGENYERVVAVLEQQCRDLGLKTRRIITPPAVVRKMGIGGTEPRVSLLARWEVGAAKTLHCNGHYDVVPDTVTFSVDRRLIAEERADAAEAEIKRTVFNALKNKKLRIDIKTVIKEKAVISPPSNVFIGSFRNVVRRVLKKELRWVVTPFGTDLRYFIHASLKTPAFRPGLKAELRDSAQIPRALARVSFFRAGIPSLGYSVAPVARAHSVNEWVYVRSIRATTAIFADVMRSLAANGEGKKERVFK